MRNQLHQNSLTAFDQLDTSTRQKQVFAAIHQIGVCTRQSLAEKLGWPINRITGRVRELLELEHIQETGEKIYINGRPRSVIKVSEHMLERLNKNLSAKNNS